MKYLIIIALFFTPLFLVGQTIVISSEADLEKNLDKIKAGTPYVTVLSGDPFEEEAFALKIEKLIESGEFTIEDPILMSLKNGEDLSNYGSGELKAFAKDNGLSNAGNKAAVIERILEWFKTQ